MLCYYSKKLLTKGLQGYATTSTVLIKQFIATAHTVEVPAQEHLHWKMFHHGKSVFQYLC